MNVGKKMHCLAATDPFPCTGGGGTWQQRHSRQSCSQTSLQLERSEQFASAALSELTLQKRRRSGSLPAWLPPWRSSFP